MNKQAVGRRREGVRGELRLAVKAMLDKPGDIHLSLARATDFAEVLSVIAEEEEPLLVVLMSQAIAMAWAEELTRHGVTARALGARDAPPKQPSVVFVGPEWLGQKDHCQWAEQTMRRVLMRGGEAPTVALGAVPIISVEVAAEGTPWVPHGARREGFGFARAAFAVRPIGGTATRDAEIRRWLAEGAHAGQESTFVHGRHLMCARTPHSFAQLARWMAATEADDVSVLFGPDDLLRLQLTVAQRVLPLLEHGAWPPPPPADVFALLAWIEGKVCRSLLYGAAFGEVVPACEQCEACVGAAVESGAGGTEEFATPPQGMLKILATPSARLSQSHGDPLIVARGGDVTSREMSLAREKLESAHPPLLSPSEAVALESLREWRTKRARADEIPAYVVFGNATLIDIVRARPRDRDSFLAIKGCGEKKWARFGEEVVNLVAESVM